MDLTTGHRGPATRPARPDGPGHHLRAPLQCLRAVRRRRRGADIPDAAWQRRQVLNTIFRFYPAVGTVHAPHDAIRHLPESASIDPRQIEQIQIGLVDSGRNTSGALFCLICR